MTRDKILFWIGRVEILIGSITISSIILSLIFGMNTKSKSVLVFVLVTATLSFFVGIGIILLSRTAYFLLVYFSSVIVLTKILIFAGIIQLAGSLSSAVPDPVKNFISIAYHMFVIIYLNRPSIKALYFSREPVRVD